MLLKLHQLPHFEGAALPGISFALTWASATVSAAPFTCSAFRSALFLMLVSHVIPSVGARQVVGTPWTPEVRMLSVKQAVQLRGGALPQGNVDTEAALSVSPKEIEEGTAGVPSVSPKKLEEGAGVPNISLKELEEAGEIAGQETDVLTAAEFAEVVGLGADGEQKSKELAQGRLALVVAAAAGAFGFMSGGLFALIKPADATSCMGVVLLVAYVVMYLAAAL
eukprot:CAMPEP_0119300834 /NCGR_PEP_ID=MMETSP1333-20130426/2722_1 /TAXON_ID=418940 /ORGANISM="Scyphosphaera apsteinii, Strain RCC1455" /LENGTH=222 /DNA_ID=CAMNT_0007302739 /DNA_START=207 /DNA_END=875 /DNA_ORIENTATION=+